MPLNEPKTFGPYQLLRRVGGGGMAEIFEARRGDGPPDRPTVAIKRILPELVSNERVLSLFADEVDLLGQLSHPSIVRVLESGHIGGVPYLAMEFIQGETLRTVSDHFRSLGHPLSVQTTVCVGIPIADALSYLHHFVDPHNRLLPIVHCDVTPTNILLGYDGTVKLIDFGIARTKKRKTDAGAIQGSYPYMSPEQVHGVELDPRSDVFSLGSVLYECAVGKRAFDGESSLAIMERVRKGIFVRPTEANLNVPREFESILMRALAFDPKRRYADARELLGVLRAFAEQSHIDLASAPLTRWMTANPSDKSPPEQESALGVPSGAQSEPARTTPANRVSVTHGAVPPIPKRPPRPPEPTRPNPFDQGTPLTLGQSATRPSSARISSTAQTSDSQSERFGVLHDNSGPIVGDKEPTVNFAEQNRRAARQSSSITGPTPTKRRADESTGSITAEDEWQELPVSKLSIESVLDAQTAPRGPSTIAEEWDDGPTILDPEHPVLGQALLGPEREYLAERLDPTPVAAAPREPPPAPAPAMRNETPRVGPVYKALTVGRSVEPIDPKEAIAPTTPEEPKVTAQEAKAATQTRRENQRERAPRSVATAEPSSELGGARASAQWTVRADQARSRRAIILSMVAGAVGAIAVGLIVLRTLQQREELSHIRRELWSVDMSSDLSAHTVRIPPTAPGEALQREPTSEASSHEPATSDQVQPRKAQTHPGIAADQTLKTKAAVVAPAERRGARPTAHETTAKPSAGSHGAEPSSALLKNRPPVKSRVESARPPLRRSSRHHRRRAEAPLATVAASDLLVPKLLEHAPKQGRSTTSDESAAQRTPGFLVISSRPRAKIVIDGKQTRRETPVKPDKPLSLSPGAHQVTLMVGSRSFVFQVEITAGKATSLTRVLPVE